LQFGNGIKNLPFGSLLVACTLLRGSAPCHRILQARSPGQAAEWRVAERATLLQDSAPVKSHEGCRRAARVRAAVGLVAAPPVSLPS